MRFATRKVCVKPEAHIVRTYPSFCNMTECFGVFLFPPGWHADPLHNPLPPLPAALYLPVPPPPPPPRVKCQAKKHNTMSPGQSLNPDHSIWIPVRYPCGHSACRIDKIKLSSVLPGHPSYKLQTPWKRTAPRPHHRQSCSNQT